MTTKMKRWNVLRKSDAHANLRKKKIQKTKQDKKKHEE